MKRLFRLIARLYDAHMVERHEYAYQESLRRRINFLEEVIINLSGGDSSLTADECKAIAAEIRARKGEEKRQKLSLLEFTKKLTNA